MSKLIAVIDDDPDVVEVLKVTLKSRGYDVVTASDGEEGLRLVHAKKPDLVILDLRMPRVSGLEVSRRLRDDPETQQIPIIILSAVGEKSGRSEEFWREGLGTADFISKPYDDLALLGRVEAVLRRRQYVSHRRANGKANGPAAAGRTPLGQATPREIVRCFVESWNEQNFGEEFGCLGESMRGPHAKAQYVALRQQAFAGAASHTQHLLSVLEEDTGKNEARVLVEREDRTGRRSLRRREEYTLRKMDDGWKIVGVRLPK